MNPSQRNRLFAFWLRLLLLGIVSVAIGTATVSAQVTDTSLVVDTTIDDGALAACDDAVSNDCSLRGAIDLANANPSMGFMVELPAGIYQLTQVGATEDANATGDLDITNPTGITLQGAGAATTFIQAGSNTSDGIDRVFDIHSSGNLSMEQVTVRYGQAVGGGPGAIFVRSSSGMLTIRNSIITENTSLTNGIDRVGGIWNNGTLEVSDSVFKNNLTTAGHVGAIYNVTSGVAYIYSSSFEGNTGPATYNINQLLVESSTFVNNGGGALYNSGVATVINSTVSGNTDSSNSYALYNSTDDTLTINHTTVTGNSRGIFNNGTLHLNQTIVADSTAGTDCFNGSTGTIGTNSNNLIEDGTCSPMLSSDPQLGPLQDNGGATHTHALLPGSSAIDAGENFGCPETDQRGIARPQNGDGDSTNICDIGAYEVADANAVAVTLPDDATTPPNSQVTIPVQVPSAVDGLDIIAYSFRLTFDPSVLSLPANATEAFDTTGTLSDGWTITANTNNPGELRLAGFHVAPLSGSGTLLNLVFDVVGPANSSTALTWSDFLFNEGVPGVETTDGFLTVVSWTLAGQVFYQEEANRAMSGVTLDLSGATTAQTMTDLEGYSFTIEATGAHTVTPTYAGPANGISAFDAAYIAQCVAGLRDSVDCPLLAADTSGNSSLSAFDAALIAQYAAGLAGPTSRVGTWVFAPVERVYAVIDSDLPAETYGAYLVGEVTGNWSPPAAAAATREANGVQTAVPLAVATAADQTAVTLNLVQPQDDLLAFEITMRYDATAGHFVEALPLAGWHLVTNEVEPGVVKLVGYGVTPATDELVTLHFQSAAGTAQTVTPVLTMVQLNEASPWLVGTQDEEAEVLSWKEYLPIIVK